MGKNISITGKDGFEFGAYLSEPEGSPRGGLVICQEIFGVNSYLKSVCEFYADAGYLTVAPAFFDRIERDVNLDYTPEGREEAHRFKAKSNWDVALEDLEAAQEYLRSVGVKRVGIVGFCWGGTLGWLFACRRKVDCVVAYYGSEIHEFPEEHARNPVIMHIGEEDRTIPPPKLEIIKKTQAGTPIYMYPKAPHGFDNVNREKNNPAAAKLARERSLEFLRKHIG